MFDKNCAKCGKKISYGEQCKWFNLEFCHECTMNFKKIFDNWLGYETP